MILFEAEDAIGVSRLNREIMDFLAIAEPAVTMDMELHQKKFVLMEWDRLRE